MGLYKVLLVDDEEDIRVGISRKMDWNGLGFELVGEAENGRDALELAESVQPDVVLTNIKMPFMDGLELCSILTKRLPGSKFVVFSGFDDFEYAKAGIEDEIVAYLLKPISMAELTEELRKIHDKIEKRLASLTRPQGGAEALRMVTATMLLDEYARPEPPAAAESLRSAGMEIRGDEHIVVAAFSLPDGAHPELLPMAERIFSRAFSCCGFSSGDRTVLLLASCNGFGRLYASLDELRQATRRAWGWEALAGLSKEYASLGDGHTAYLEAMEALKIARRGGGLYAAGGWDDMAMLCARALKIIEKEYMDEELSLQSVSERLHISANYLGANIKKFYGDTFMNLLIQKRMDVALKLLWSGSSRIAEVSRRCGYADQSYFGYCFKKYYGKSPARMRQEQKEANA